MIIILNGFETDIDILPSNCITTMEENSVLISLNMKKWKHLMKVDIIRNCLLLYFQIVA